MSLSGEKTLRENGTPYKEPECITTCFLRNLRTNLTREQEFANAGLGGGDILSEAEPARLSSAWMTCRRNGTQGKNLLKEGAAAKAHLGDVSID